MSTLAEDIGRRLERGASATAAQRIWHIRDSDLRRAMTRTLSDILWLPDRRA